VTQPPIPATATAAERQIIRLLRELNSKADIIMAVQDDINTTVATLNDGTAQIVTAVEAIGAGEGVGIDTSKLTAALPPFVQAVQSLTALVPPAGTDAPAPTDG
jgi:hypothetical protein